MSDGIETGIVSVSNDNRLVFRMMSFHHIIQSSVFIVNIAWMNHTVNKATVKGIKKETDMISVSQQFVIKVLGSEGKLSWHEFSSWKYWYLLPW